MCLDAEDCFQKLVLPACWFESSYVGAYHHLLTDGDALGLANCVICDYQHVSEPGVAQEYAYEHNINDEIVMSCADSNDCRDLLISSAEDVDVLGMSLYGSSLTEKIKELAGVSENSEINVQPLVNGKASLTLQTGALIYRR
ncbi:hypothetical protein P170DRAFT_509447 [Aspergillus steynii IBT 23096]|uniref:Uncharacterized protein n=1 Tax=Aspergillus steynii IBT 23096 TaxID=1392250 RepID=A0A2I2G770_9EURO|nr:uncharacterized protein P170DRAFT_509447 [Aspergillus steynii IBT 23096]PLB48708.1 hypothetical protein P170DRAFT_509447 [Aspergillus steynii IBT 23096]